MKRNEMKRLCILFHDITGMARAVLVRHTLEALQALGYTLAESLEDGCESVLGFVVCSTCMDWRSIGFYHQSIRGNKTGIQLLAFMSRPDTDVFVASNELKTFLKRAESQLTVVEQIEGVDVTISATEIKLDLTQLTKRVTDSAKVLQCKMYGEPKI